MVTASTGRGDEVEGMLPGTDLAVIGSGAAGLAAAWLLATRHRVTIYERELRVGGHAHSVDIDHGGRRLSVDTGFLVYNTHNYPNFTRLLDALGVESHESDMSFAASFDGGAFEYAGDRTLKGLIAQPVNLLRPNYWRMLADVVRFYKRAERDAADPVFGNLTVGEYLRSIGYSRAFIDGHLMPMAAAIWSAPRDRIARFPLRAFVAFFANHGLLQLKDRPRWRTISGGSARYVEKIVNRPGISLSRGSPVVRLCRRQDGVYVRLADGSQKRHDAVIVATHADTALRLLGPDASVDERRVLAAFQYQKNVALLHRDARLMPKRRRAWAAWNYVVGVGTRGSDAVAVTYWLNRLQGFGGEDVFVSINPMIEPSSEKVIARFSYDHPLYDTGSFEVQSQLASLQGHGGIWFAGSYFGFGFHEDAIASGLNAAEAFGVIRPWRVADFPAPAPSLMSRSQPGAA